jgi:uncharacterized protein YciI
VYHLLMYDLVDDYLERRPAFREEHLELARQAHERGELLLAGALDDPSDTAVLLFRGDGPEAARSFAEADPYVRAGLVKGWRVRPWNVVVGGAGQEPGLPPVGPR